MKTSELLALLQAFHRDRVALRARHVVGAIFITTYEFNNTYQYVIAREDVQISWLERAIRELGGSPLALDTTAEPPGTGRGGARMRAVLMDDARLAQAFVDRWQPQVDVVTHNRHRRMLQVILGETLEHTRFFEQMSAGRADVLGRRADEAGSVGSVLPTRWVE